MTMRESVLPGAAVVVSGVVIVLLSLGFPTVGGMQFGPGLFPRIVGGGLVVSGLGMGVEALRAGGGLTAPGPFAARSLWLAASIAFFALTVEPLGFHIAAAVTLFAVTTIARGRLATALALALAGPVLLHVMFYTVLRVPLPWGLLLPVAW